MIYFTDTLKKLNVPVKPVSLSTVVSIVFGVGGIFILTWLYINSNSVSMTDYNNYTQQLRDLRKVDARINTELLSENAGLSNNYDALTSHSRNLMVINESLSSPPEFLLSNDYSKLVKQTSIIQSMVNNKLQLINIYKSKASILRNSRVFFRKVSNELIDLKPETTFKLQYYVRYMLNFMQVHEQDSFFNHNIIEKLNFAQKNLTVLETESYDPQVMNNLIQHGNIIKEYVPLIETNLRSILNLPISEQITKLLNSHTEGYQNALFLAKRYRIGLYFIAILLTAYLVNVFIRLKLTRQTLHKTYNKLVERYESQKVFEKRLQIRDIAFNHALEGIMITDDREIIIDVNPAFSRITGYQRENVIGNTPSILSSGRHDSKFYLTMRENITRNGYWRGEIWNRNQAGKIYPENLSICSVLDSENKISNFVAVFSDISVLKQQEKKLHKMAYYDSLTELPNRVLLRDRLNQSIMQCQRTQSFMAVCYLDLDGFKPINDIHGHESGDRLLMEISNRLKNLLRRGDTVARLGGDEFVYIFIGLKKNTDFEPAIHRLLKYIKQPIVINKNWLSISASIGVAIYPDDNCDADGLLRHADLAMYQAKQMGKNRFCLFDHEKDTSLRSNYLLTSTIKSALENDEFVLFYQPKVDMRKGIVVGMEALIRWQHPEKGLIFPDEFLPIVEDHEIIIDIGKWVILTVMKQLDYWQSEGLSIPVSVNLSGHQLLDMNFVLFLAEALDKYPMISANNLELEILETTALGDIYNVTRIISECMKLGVIFAIDDFGTGYSSITYLKKLPASVLKIDRSFVQDLDDPENLAIIKGIMGLAEIFQMKVIAEGVESIEHGKILMQVGCYIAQGYVISKPIPAEKILLWIKEWQPHSTWKSMGEVCWSDKDFPILLAELEHGYWITLLLNAVSSGNFNGYKNVNIFENCYFGKWFYGCGHKNYSHKKLFQQLEYPHKRMHDIALRMESYIQDSQAHRAKELIPDLLKQRDEIVNLLKNLGNEI